MVEFHLLFLKQISLIRYVLRMIEEVLYTQIYIYMYMKISNQHLITKGFALNQYSICIMSENLLKTVVWNIEGLTWDKINDTYFYQIISQFHIIGFVETWTNDIDKNFNIHGFQLLGTSNRTKQKLEEEILVALLYLLKML